MIEIKIDRIDAKCKAKMNAFFIKSSQILQQQSLRDWWETNQQKYEDIKKSLHNKTVINYWKKPQKY